MMRSLTLRSIFILGISLTTSATALAQYVWLDENGHKQYSDQAPPASVPKNKILKFPGKTSDDLESSKSTDKTKQPESLADKDLAYKKRRDELAAKEKKDADDAKAAASKSENCKRAKEYKANLESGVRMSDVDANGNRTFMTDEKRAQELNNVQQNMTDCN